MMLLLILVKSLNLSKMATIPAAQLTFKLKVFFHRKSLDFSFQINLCLFSEYPHTFTSELRGQDVVENDLCSFEIDVEAEDAEVTWYHNGRPIPANDSRFTIVSIGKKRRLTFKAQLNDSGEICVKTNTQESKCQLTVTCNLARFNFTISFL